MTKKGRHEKREKRGLERNKERSKMSTGLVIFAIHAVVNCRNNVRS